MAKIRKSLQSQFVAGGLSAALVCASSAAMAQELYYGPAPNESVVVRPPYDRIYSHQVLGNINGEINPSVLAVSRSVSYADLDLSQSSDLRELQARVSGTAQQLCDELNARVVPDEDANRNCVNTAIRNAMRDVSNRTG